MDLMNRSTTQIWSLCQLLIPPLRLLNLLLRHSNCRAASTQQQIPTAPSIASDFMFSDDLKDWHPLRALLFYRAVLVCMLISTAIDSDAFITSGVAIEVVQVL
jgi:hypothetical protein